MNPWKKLSEKIVIRKPVKIMSRTFQLPDGNKKTYSVRVERDLVYIFAVTRDEKIILQKQFRPGPEKILLEVPSGGINPGEHPSSAAHREFLEETGFTGKFQQIGALQSASSTRTKYIFTATDCHKIQEPVLEDDELFAEIIFMEFPQFLNLVRQGDFTHTEVAYLALIALGKLHG